MEEKDGKDAIVSNIILNAEREAAALLASALNDKDAALEQNRIEVERKKQAEIAAAQAEAKLLVERRISVANLERGKTILKAKQLLIASAYDQAVNKILIMADNLYRDFIGSFIEKYAENNDVVIICERDAKRLNTEFVDKLSAKLKITLRLSGEYHTGRGGVILSGKYYDKNLTLDTLINSIRTQSEARVAKKIFNE